jgi:predicted site-specific integrase-resolvase
MLTYMESPSDLIGSAESCRILGIHPATLGRWVAAGVLTTAHRLPGKNGAHLFKRVDIEALAAEKRAAEQASA